MPAASHALAWYRCSTTFFWIAGGLAVTGALCLWAGVTIAAVVFIALAALSIAAGRLAFDRHRYHRTIGLIAIDNKYLHPERSQAQLERMARRQARRGVSG
jgi:hypothetical protein